MSERTSIPLQSLPTRQAEGRTVLDTSAPPAVSSRVVDDFKPALIDVAEHHLCPGCGEPIAMRSVLEAVSELGLTQQTIAVFGIGCYTAFSNNLDVEVLQALHGRAPSLATGVKRAKPDTTVLTIQGDGDMVNEGLQEVIHAAARGEAITCFMLDNGVFGETGGHITATTVLGQRTKNTLDGRDAKEHGYPIRLSNLLAQLEGASYVARCAVNTAGNVSRAKRMITRALEVQQAGGFSFVEILTMCPTGWFIETQEAPSYLADNLAAVHTIGVLKDSAPLGDGAVGVTA
jgi:2-oxoglutarate ferredoxin oxidoreductase subunit beta